MRQLFGLRIRHQMLRRAPILQKNERAREPHFRMQESKLWLTIELLEHSRHRHGHWPPLVDEHRSIDSHTNEKDNESAFQVCGKPIAMNHNVLPIEKFTSGTRTAAAGSTMIRIPSPVIASYPSKRTQTPRSAPSPYRAAPRRPSRSKPSHFSLAAPKQPSTRHPGAVPRLRFPPPPPRIPRRQTAWR